MHIKPIFKALACTDTPGPMLYGMLQVGSQFFFGLKERYWLNDFEDYLKNIFMPEDGAYLYSSDAKTFVKYGLISLHDSLYIDKILSVLLGYFEKNPEETINLLFSLCLDKLESLTEKQQAQLEKVICEGDFDHLSALLHLMQEHHLLQQELLEKFLSAYSTQKEILRHSDRYALYNFCKLSEGCPSIVFMLKSIILERNIWDCGVDGSRFSETNQVFLMELGDSFVWTNDELVLIYNNLTENLHKISKKAGRQEVLVRY